MAVNRDEVLARLARTDVVSLRDKANQRDYPVVLKAVADRIEKEIPHLLTSINRQAARNAIAAHDAATLAVPKLIKVLEDSRLTINFKACNWFYTRNKYKSYTNFFERGTSGASNDRVARNKAEMALGRYDGKTYRRGPRSPEEEAALERIAEYGVMDQDKFVPRLRPRYAALDFGGARYGGCAKYGHSYLVLHDHLKANATFCHMDSFSVEGDLKGRAAEFSGPAPTLASSTATYSSLGRLLLYCRPEQLVEIANYALGVKQTGTADKLFGGLLYIEAHLHADIVFSRDVKYVMIANGKGLENGLHPRLRAKWPWKKTMWDAKDEQRVLKNAKRFAQDNGIIMLRV